MNSTAVHTACINRCLYVFSFIPKQIFKILQSQKLKLLRTVTHTILSCLAVLSVFMTLARNVSHWVAFCVYALNARQWLNVCIRTLWHLDAPLRSLRESDEEERYERDEMRWEKRCGLKQAERVQMLKRSGAWKGGSSAERRKRKE